MVYAPTEKEVVEQWRMIHDFFPEKSHGDRIIVPSKENIGHYTSLSIYPIAEHLISVVKEIPSKKLFFYSNKSTTKLLPEIWANEFAQELAHHHCAKMTINQRIIDEIEITFVELLETVIPELQIDCPFLAVEVEDHSDEVGHYVVLTSCYTMYKAA